MEIGRGVVGVRAARLLGSRHEVGTAELLRVTAREAKVQIAIFGAQRPMVGEFQLSAGAGGKACRPDAVVRADGQRIELRRGALHIGEVPEFEAGQSIEQQIGPRQEADATDQADPRTQRLLMIDDRGDARKQRDIAARFQRDVAIERAGT